MSAKIDRKDFAERVFALSGIGVGALARKLGTTIATLDRIVCRQNSTEATYARILPRLEDLERQLAEYKAAGAPALTLRERVVDTMRAGSTRGGS